jgi:hypothetical protein
MGHPHPQHHRPRVHKAHPHPPVHIQTAPPPPPPPGLSAEKYLLSILAAASTACQNWKTYGSSVEQAYGEAYRSQAGVLREVKEVIEARRKEQEAAFVFALNILTIGVASGLATAAEKYVVGKVVERAAARGAERIAEKSAEHVVEKAETHGAELVKKFTSSVTDKVSDKAADAGKELGEWANKFGHTSMDDAFKPPVVDPVQFGAEIRASIDLRANDLWNTISTFMRPDILQSMSTDMAKTWYQTIMSMPFVLEAPPSMSPKELMPAATRALWIAWAWERDRGYWRDLRQGQDELDRNVVEELDFEPIHRALYSCGFPPAVVNKPLQTTSVMGSAMFSRGVKGTADLLVEMRKDQSERAWSDPKSLQVIDMDKFITWSNSSDVTRVLFLGVDHRLKGDSWFAEISKRLAKRQKYGSLAPYMPD